MQNRFGPTYGHERGGLFGAGVEIRVDGDGVDVMHGGMPGRLRHVPGQGYVGHFHLGLDRFGFRADCGTPAAAAEALAQHVVNLITENDALRPAVEGVALDRGDDNGAFSFWPTHHDPANQPSEDEAA